MARTRTSFAACLTAAALAASSGAGAAENTAVACSVAVDYLHDGSPVEQYRKDFVVLQGAPFVDDFSTTLRSKEFTATVVKEAGNLVVSIDHFSDVGVFVAIGFNTSLTLRGGGGLESTSGSHSTYVSSGVSPMIVGGNHTTNYSLNCRRA